MDNIEVYICPVCKKLYPNISNSAPSKDGELCISCLIKQMDREELAKYTGNIESLFPFGEPIRFKEKEDGNTTW